MRATLVFLVLLLNISEAFHTTVPSGTFNGLVVSHRLPRRTFTASARWTTSLLRLTSQSPDENDEVTDTRRDNDSKPSETASASSDSSSRTMPEEVTADSIVSSIRQKRSEEVLETNGEEEGTKYPINLPSPILLSASMVLAIAATGR